MTGLDTETHRGRIVLIATPRQDLELWRYRPGEQWHVLIEWLRLQDDRFVCWNADYDIQAALKLLERFTNETIMRRTSARYGRYRVRFVPSKFFRVGVQHGKKADNSKTLFTIYDLMQFYASSLEKAALKILGKSKTDPGVEWDRLLETLKCGGVRAQTIRDYCRNDAALVEELYQHSKRAMNAAGVNFDKPISCASVAVQKFSKAMAHDVPREINNAFEKTYRGGRIECLRVGYFPKAYLYDIHSAYPSVMAQLPATVGQWLPIDGEPRPDALYGALQVRLSVPRDYYRCPVPVKGETQLMYPYGSWGQWVDLETYRVLEKEGLVQKIKRGFQLVASEGIKRPFAALAEMYQERQRQPSQTWALKIIMNALYGKVAERIGKWFPSVLVNREAEAWRGNFWTRREQWTKRTNFVYASAITAGIRLRMYREIPPEDTIFYATDGVMLMKPITQALDVGPGLGQWSEPETVTDLVVVGSGVYTYKDAEGKAHTKMRGFEVGLDLYELLDRRRRVLTLQVRRNWTLAQAIRQRKYSMFNELVDVPRYLDVCFDRKRIWERDRTGRDLLKDNFTSRPWAHYPDVTYREF
jgi:hypothetical protein